MLTNYLISMLFIFLFPPTIVGYLAMVEKRNHDLGGFTLKTNPCSMCERPPYANFIIMYTFFFAYWYLSTYIR